MSDPNSSNWVLVPMELTALVIGQSPVPGVWSDLSPDFTTVFPANPNSLPVVLGPDLVTAHPVGTPPAALEEGIHLHWLLPNAFGRAEEGSANYPLIPNRWLVRRVRYQPGSATVAEVTGWIVESDYRYTAADETPPPATVTTLRFDDATPASDYAIGRTLPQAGWKETGHDRFAPLTALGNGVAHFSSHYRACRNVLGLYDPTPAGQAPGAWDVSYQVSGWHVEAAAPAGATASIPLLADLPAGTVEADWTKKLAELQWTFLDHPGVPGSVEPAPPFPAGVLCHGAVTRVVWDPSQAYVPPARPAQTTVCLGNTVAETMAALLAAQLQNKGWDPSHPLSPGDTAAERLLAAFQYGTLAGSGQLMDVETELHQHRFASHPGDDRYVIEPQNAATPGNAAAPAPQTIQQAPATQPLPDDIALALYNLNQSALAAGQLEGELASLQQTLFSTWSQWAAAYLQNGLPAPPDPALPGATSRDAILSAQESVLVSTQQFSQAQTALASGVTTLAGDVTARLPGYQLTLTTNNGPTHSERPFFRPRDPVLLLSGAGLGPSGVYAGSDEPGTRLRCRFPNEVAARVVMEFSGNSASAVTVAEAQLFGQMPIPWLDPSFTGPPAGLLDGLLFEMLLLDPPASTGTPPTSTALQTALTNQAGRILSSDEEQALSTAATTLLSGTAMTASSGTVSLTVESTAQKTATRPAPMALLRWAQNPWRPLFLAWKVSWYPDATLYPTPGGDPVASWQGWTLPGQGQGEEWQTPPSLPQSAACTYESFAMLHPHPERALRRRLQKLLPDDNISAVISKLDAWPILVQSLGGFHEQLRQLRPGLELPPASIDFVFNGTGSKLDPIAPVFSRSGDARAPMHAPNSNADASFQPIRAGQLLLGSVRVVDTFGQVCPIIDSTVSPGPQLLPSLGFPTSSPSSNGPLIPLPPRYVQPARLGLRWVSAEDGAPAASPLCGWIFPNYLDQSILFSDAGGKLWGGVQAILRTSPASGSTPAFQWIPAPGTNCSPTDLPDPHLRAVAQSFLSFEASVRGELLAAIQSAEEDSAGPVEHDPRLSILVGRPLAVVRATVQYELMGLPVAPLPASPPALPPEPGQAAPAPFTGLQFPVRLGGPSEVPGAAGGLVGYLVDGSPAFYPRYGLEGQSAPGVIEYGHEMHVNARDLTALTLVLDPAAPVYLRSPLMPVHAFSLPKVVAAGVSRIQNVFFQASPLLGPAGPPQIPRPSDDYGQWSWAIRPQVTFWQEYPQCADPGDRASFSQAPLQLQEGWLKLVMNPVQIDAFWVKQGGLTVPAGSTVTVTLGWMVDGGETLILSADGTSQPLATWTAQPGSGLPTEYQLQVTAPLSLTLAATDSRGNRSVRSLQISTK